MKYMIALGLLLCLGIVGCVIEGSQPVVQEYESDNRYKRHHRRGRHKKNIWRNGCKYRFDRHVRDGKRYKITRGDRDRRRCYTYEYIYR